VRPVAGSISTSATWTPLGKDGAASNELFASRLSPSCLARSASSKSAILRSVPVLDPVRPGAALYSLEGDFGFSAPNATSPAPEIGHEVKLINFNQVPGSPLALRIQNFARNSTGDEAFIVDNLNAFNRPLNVRFGPDGCAYVPDYGAVRDLGADTHFVGPPANGPLVQIPGTGVIWKICPM